MNYFKNANLTSEEIEFLSESNAIESVYDARSLDDAVRAWVYLKKQKSLTEEVVLKTHQLLMKHLLDKREAGHFRICQVYIGGREGLYWWMISEALQPWLMNTNLYPQHWQSHHVRYEQIHPFVDGNGRTGRMFMNWERLKAKEPVLVLLESEKHKYYNWFNSL